MGFAQFDVAAAQGSEGRSGPLQAFQGAAGK
uniref:Uncharacterized protein n=1 Tax=Burkholderia sp. (strain CCGE1003) TaxID=640512 RepID=E1TCP4_BURSG